MERVDNPGCFISDSRPALIPSRPIQIALISMPNYLCFFNHDHHFFHGTPPRRVRAQMSCKEHLPLFENSTEVKPSKVGARGKVTLATFRSDVRPCVVERSGASPEYYCPFYRVMGWTVRYARFSLSHESELWPFVLGPRLSDPDGKVTARFGPLAPSGFG